MDVQLNIHTADMHILQRQSTGRMNISSFTGLSPFSITNSAACFFFYIIFLFLIYISQLHLSGTMRDGE